MKARASIEDYYRRLDGLRICPPEDLPATFALVAGIGRACRLRASRVQFDLLRPFERGDAEIERQITLAIRKAYGLTRLSEVQFTLRMIGQLLREFKSRR